MRGDAAAVDARPHVDPLGAPPRPRLIASSVDESAASVFTGVQWVVFATALLAVALLLTVDSPLVAQLTHDVLVVVFLSVAAWRVSLVLLARQPAEPTPLP